MKKEIIPEKRNFYIHLLSLLSLPSYIWCAIKHVCMCGHMAHPPYSIIDWVNDIFWITFMVAATVFAIKSTIKRKKVFISALILLIFSRLLLGSGGGLLFYIELPLIVFIIIISFAGIKKYSAFK